MAERGRGRQPGFVMSQEHRDKIRNSNILTALIECVEGKREMSGSQVTAGLGLLKKVMPDTATVTLQGDEEGGPIRHSMNLTGLDDSDLDQLARLAEKASSATKSD